MQLFASKVNFEFPKLKIILPPLSKAKPSKNELFSKITFSVS